MSDKHQPAREAGKFSRRDLLKGAVAGASALAIPAVSHAHGQTAARDPEDKVDLSREHPFTAPAGRRGSARSLSVTLCT